MPQKLASVAPGTLLYAIGDIHGRLDLLEDLERQIVHDSANREAERRLIVCLGDYVDRGDDSRGVVEHLVNDPPKGFERICLRGNHEAFLEKFLDDYSVGEAWFANGGTQTLNSYGVRAAHDEAGLLATQNAFLDRLPQTHRDFLSSLSLFYEEGDYIFVHAGIRPGVGLNRQVANDLLWIRDEFLEDERDHGAVIVHGHTIDLQPQVHTNRIGIDTGAYATDRLTALVLHGSEQSFLSTK